VHCPSERLLFSIANWVFFHEFFRLVSLKYWNNIPRLLFYPFQDNQQKMPSASQNTDAMTFPADGTDFVLFGAEQPASVRCFYCSLDFGV
jgi:hypothetical protein